VFDGKAFNPNDSQFSYSRVSEDVDNILIDDANKYFSIESLFSAITKGLEVEGKGKDRVRLSFEDTPKFLVDSNRAINIRGGSALRRTVELEIFDFYHYQYTPLMDMGHIIFDDWDEDEWLKFDHFMIQCQLEYLQLGLKRPKLSKLAERKLLQSTSRDFVEFMDMMFTLNVEGPASWVSPVSGHHLSRFLLEEGRVKPVFLELFRSKFPENDEKVLKQNRFTGWQKIYAEYHGLKFNEYRKREDKIQFQMFAFKIPKES